MVIGHNIQLLGDGDVEINHLKSERLPDVLLEKKKGHIFVPITVQLSDSF